MMGLQDQTMIQTCFVKVAVKSMLCVLPPDIAVVVDASISHSNSNDARYHCTHCQ